MRNTPTMYLKGFALRLLSSMFIMFYLVYPSVAQDTDTLFVTATPHTQIEIEPETIIITAEDGTLLVGDFYLIDPSNPTILLLHQIYTNRNSWEPVLEPLLEAEYNLLAVDLRGYGESVGGINWHKAVDDTQLWFDWLRADGGVRGDAISTMGSSMGSTMAIIGCANDELCKSSVAISPGWDYYGMRLDEALSEGMSNRPLLILYTERDRWPVLGMPNIQATTTGLLDITMLSGNAHGMDVLKQHEESLPMILSWLDVHSGR